MITRAGFGVREPLDIRPQAGMIEKQALVESTSDIALEPSSLPRRHLAVELIVSASVPKVGEGRNKL